MVLSCAESRHDLLIRRSPMRKRHALFVAFHVPPEASSSGVLRTLKYIRYLDELGWRVTVVSPRVGAYAVTDPALERQFPDSCRVIRTPFLNTKRHLSLLGRYPALLAVPDSWIGWLPWGVAAGRRLADSDPFDLVYSTSPYATSHLIAWRIARHARRPWVTDFRDPWYEDIPEPGAPSGPVFRGIDRRLERTVIANCQRVVTSTVSLRDTFRARYPREAPDRADPARCRCRASSYGRKRRSRYRSRVRTESRRRSRSVASQCEYRRFFSADSQRGCSPFSACGTVHRSSPTTFRLIRQRDCGRRLALQESRCWSSKVRIP